MRTPRASLALLAAVLAVAAGCSAKSPKRTDTAAPAGTAAAAATGAETATGEAIAADAYQTQVLQGLNAMGSYGRVLSKVRATNLKSVAPKLARARTDFVHELDATAALVPPAPFAKAHAALITAWRALDGDMKAVATAAAANDPARFLRADRSFVATTREVQKAADAFAAAAGG